MSFSRMKLSPCVSVRCSDHTQGSDQRAADQASMSLLNWQKTVSLSLRSNEHGLQAVTCNILHSRGADAAAATATLMIVRVATFKSVFLRASISRLRRERGIMMAKTTTMMRAHYCASSSSLFLILRRASELATSEGARQLIPMIIQAQQRPDAWR